jgi:hypothetical protein
VIIILFRIHIVFPFLPGKQNDLGYYKNRDKWADDISQLAAGRPVLFVENFREAGLYTFYSGNMSVALFSNANRKSQYDLWGYEDSIQGKKVLVIWKRCFPGCNELRSQLGKMICYHGVSNFESYYNIPAKIKPTISGRDTLHVSIEIINDRKTDLNFYTDSLWQQPTLFYEIRKHNKTVITDTLKIFSEKDKLLSGISLILEYKLPVKSLGDGIYYFSAGFYSGSLPPSYNSMNNKFVIKRQQ